MESGFRDVYPTIFAGLLYPLIFAKQWLSKCSPMTMNTHTHNNRRTARLALYIAYATSKESKKSIIPRTLFQ
jgi:hypothetical protein